jgi:hypothetical protein
MTWSWKEDPDDWMSGPSQQYLDTLQKPDESPSTWRPTIPGSGEGDYLKQLREMYSPGGLAATRKGLYQTADIAAGQASRQARERDIASGRAGSGYAGAIQGGVQAGRQQARVAADASVQQMQTQGLQIIGQAEQAERDQHMEGMSLFTSTIDMMEKMGELSDSDFVLIAKIWEDLTNEVARTGNFNLYTLATARLWELGQDTGTVDQQGNPK